MKLNTDQRRRLRVEADDLVASAKATRDPAYRSLAQARLQLKGRAEWADVAWSHLGYAAHEAEDSELKERIVSLRNALGQMIR